LARVGLFATVLSAVIGWILGGRVLRPLKRLRTEADLVRVTDDLSKRVDTGGPTEITALAKDINAMLARLESAAFDTALALTSSREFGSNVAHELRTPLTSMRLNLDLLRGANLEPNDQAPILEQMLLQQDRLLRTLDALRLLSRGDLTQGESSFEEVDLIEVISQAFQREFNGDQNANLSLDLSNEIPLMLGWGEGLDVIFRNIFENITAHAVRPDQKLAVNVTARLMAGEVCISIEDNGPGIVSTERARVFERFYQVTGGNSQGSGLGLSLVDQQMVIHGGKVVIGKSDLGGALVTLTFPIEKNNQS
jgi:two-component system sensor histidine kinase PrrB